MKTITLPKRFIVTAMAAVTAASLATTADACSRILVDTPYGESVVRTLDWGEKLGTIARALPAGTERQTRAVAEYQSAARWSTQYRTMLLEEHNLFHGAVAEAINDQGLSASVLYMYDSEKFLTQHQDTGAPAVNKADVVGYMAENYASVAEVKAALEAGEFQIAWGSEIPEAGKHGLHFSVHDKSGDVLLIQLNQGGKQVLHHGDADLRVMANEPLQQDHREYVAQFDMDDIMTATQLNTSISSLDRNARLLWTTHNQKNWQDLTWLQTEAKLQSTFDAAALVPHEVIDPNYQGTYTTWIQYVYNLETGSFKLRNLETYTELRFNLDELSDITQPVCADLAAQASAGLTAPKWQVCQ